MFIINSKTFLAAATFLAASSLNPSFAVIGDGKGKEPGAPRHARAKPNEDEATVAPVVTQPRKFTYQEASQYIRNYIDLLVAWPEFRTEESRKKNVKGTIAKVERHFHAYGRHGEKRTWEPIEISVARFTRDEADEYIRKFPDLKRKFSGLDPDDRLYWANRHWERNVKHGKKEKRDFKGIVVSEESGKKTFRKPSNKKRAALPSWPPASDSSA